MNLLRSLLIAVLVAHPAFGQISTRNPVDELKDQVGQVLADAQAPFTSEQEQQLALLIEEQRQASENLFGVMWDFSNGPPQGEDRDRALAGIQWMHDEVKKKLPSYLTPEQRAAWERHESSGVQVGARVEGVGTGGAQRNRILQIRVTNNAFNVETATNGGPIGLQGGGARTEVIEHGGIGAFHGNLDSTFQDGRLNGRNPFASNKPPYHERTITGNISGPVIRDRLTLSLTLNDTRRENVGTVKVETLGGPFSLGITKPAVDRSYNARSLLQLTDAHSLNIGLQSATTDRKNENVGDFNLPDRASRTQLASRGADIRQMSVLSDRTVHDVRVGWASDHSERTPFSNALAIIVKDAFTSGGAQNRDLVDGNEFELSNLLYVVGDRLTMRSGFQGWYRREDSSSGDNFYGEFTFSDLASYRDGRPAKYRITCCDPSYHSRQFHGVLFSQNDVKVTKTFTLMLGARYQFESSVDGLAAFDPRVGFAYAAGNSTVIRGGVGAFHEFLRFSNLQAYLQLDGANRYEILIDNPGWPDPYTGGRVKPPSRRLIEPGLKPEYYYAWQIGVERSLPNNLFVTVSYENARGLNNYRSRDINAPFPDGITGQRPNPAEGQVVQLESSGASLHGNLRASARQRFSIFTLTANYTHYNGYNDQGIGSFPILPVNNYDRRAEWGIGGSPHHTFNTSINSRLPLGVYLTAVIQARGGSAYNITTGKDDNNDGTINDRPPGVAKNTERGPGFSNLSFNLSKAVAVGRSTQPAPGQVTAAENRPQVNVFLNAYNALNKTHLGTPSGVMTSPFFRKSFNATDPRRIEVGMRFQF